MKEVHIIDPLPSWFRHWFCNLGEMHKSPTDQLPLQRSLGIQNSFFFSQVKIEFGTNNGASDIFSWFLWASIKWHMHHGQNNGLRLWNEHDSLYMKMIYEEGHFMGFWPKNHPKITQNGVTFKLSKVLVQVNSKVAWNLGSFSYALRIFLASFFRISSRRIISWHNSGNFKNLSSILYFFLYNG